MPRCGHRSWGHQPALPCLICASHLPFAQTHQCQQVPTCAGRYLRSTRCLRPCVPCSRVPGLTRAPRIPGGLQAVGLGGLCSPPVRVPVLPAGPVRLADLGGPSCRFLSSWVLPQEPPFPAGAPCPLAWVDVAPAFPSAPRPHLGSPSSLAEAHL